MGQSISGGSSSGGASDDVGGGDDVVGGGGGDSSGTSSNQNQNNMSSSVGNNTEVERGNKVPSIDVSMDQSNFDASKSKSKSKNTGTGEEAAEGSPGRANMTLGVESTNGTTSTTAESCNGDNTQQGGEGLIYAKDVSGEPRNNASSTNKTLKEDELQPAEKATSTTVFSLGARLPQKLQEQADDDKDAPGSGVRDLSLGKILRHDDNREDRETQRKARKLMTASQECAQILPHLFVSGVEMARDPSVIRRCEITHIVNCSAEDIPNFFQAPEDDQSPRVTYLSLGLSDSKSERIDGFIYPVIEFIERSRREGGRTLVHCFQGVSRSVSFVVAYLMYTKNMDFDAAKNFVRVARPVARPNIGFQCQLMEWWRLLQSGRADGAIMIPRIYAQSWHRSTQAFGRPVLQLVLQTPVSTRPVQPQSSALDSRGVFAVHALPNLLHVWCGESVPEVQRKSSLRAAVEECERLIRLDPSLSECAIVLVGSTAASINSDEGETALPRVATKAKPGKTALYEYTENTGQWEHITCYDSDDLPIDGASMFALVLPDGENVYGFIGDQCT
eukprot:g1600.t1